MRGDREKAAERDFFTVVAGRGNDQGVRRASVVKLGGSLAESPFLRPWLNALAEHGKGCTVIVPGGGPFADAVRAAQASLAFDDNTAHAMALLAMHQYGWMLRGICSALTLESDVERLPARLAAGECPVWLPDVRQLDEGGIPASWDITSDSLAAWLAGRLQASDLWMVKSVAVDAGARLTELVSAGVADAAFADYARNSGCGIRWLGPEDFDELPSLFAAFA